MSHLDMPFASAASRRSVPSSIEHDMLGMMALPCFEQVQQASYTIAPYVRRTPLLRSAKLDEIAGAAVWLKPENLQVTGSFKARGAFNAMLALSPEQRQRGVVAYSTGNHGQAIAWAARQLGVTATIVMPVDAPLNKITRAASQGAHIVHYDRERESREAIGMRLLHETGATLIPPGDHPAVLAAQGTVALEALEDLPASARANLGLFAAPCGGGGLMAGCNLSLEALSPATRRVAVEPAQFDDTVRSLASGRRESNPAGRTSICDALQAVTPAQLPFSINQPLLSSATSVSDEEVAVAIRFAIQDLHLVVEPGGAVALAALLAGRLALGGQDSVIVLSGGNIDDDLLTRILNTSSAR